MHCSICLCLISFLSSRCIVPDFSWDIYCRTFPLLIKVLGTGVKTVHKEAYTYCRLYPKTNERGSWKFAIFGWKGISLLKGEMPLAQKIREIGFICFKMRSAPHTRAVLVIAVYIWPWFITILWAIISHKLQANSREMSSNGRRRSTV